MMRAYARQGAGTVYWLLLLPTPRSERFQTVFGPVDRALRRAARRFRARSSVDLGATFTPHGRFRARVRWQGKMLTVRQADGVHLSVAGAWTPPR